MVALFLLNLKSNKLDYNYITDFLDISLETENGIINIATTYLLPRRPYLPFPDFHRFFHKNKPSYLIADMNATSTQLGNTHNNQVGKHLNRFMNNCSIIHLGPNFPAYLARNTKSTLDFALCNNIATFNITLNPGPITLSDHIPIAMTITAKAILRQIPPRLNFKNTNWEIFQEEIEDKISSINLKNNMSKEEIDEKLERWYNS